MNTLEALEKYSQVCDELDSFMQAENCLLRSQSTLDEAFLIRKGEAAWQMQYVLDCLRSAGAAHPSDSPRTRETRDRVLKKLLKLMLLSRESEQLLLKVRPSRPNATAPTDHNRVRNIYQAHRP